MIERVEETTAAPKRTSLPAIPPLPSKDRQAWTKSVFIRNLIPHLFESCRSDQPSEQELLKALFDIAATIVPTVLRQPASGGPTADEIVSDVIDLFISGYAVPGFDQKRNAKEYFVGIIGLLALSYDRKHRNRGSLSLDGARLIADPRADAPPDAASRREVISITMSMWVYLTPRQREAICAEFGPVFSREPSDRDSGSKNYLAKHRGLQKLRRLLAERGVRGME